MASRIFSRSLLKVCNRIWILAALVSTGASAKVAPKGVGNYPGVPNAVASMKDLHVGWYYDWGTSPVGETPGIQFVPMIWGHNNVNTKDLDAARASGSVVLLGFNEPNVHGQANMTVEQAIADWPQIQATGLRLGSPASGTGDDMKPDGWLARFMEQARAHRCRVDFICIQPYQSNFDPVQATENLRKEIAFVHNRYHLPIWVTEYGMVNWDTNTYPDAATAARFATLSAAMMSRLRYVERYAWYSLIPNQETLSLSSRDGSLNVIGKAWAGAAGGARVTTGPNQASASAAQPHPLLNGRCLVPEQSATAPNYFCTWAAQNYTYGQGFASMDPAILEGGSGASLACNSLNEQVVFGPQGWAREFYPRIRKDLYFLFDNGYYVGDADSFELDPHKFPSFTGTPEQRLKALDDALLQSGWRGLGLWTKNTPQTDDKIDPLLEWTRYAGVKYWKIDGGDWDFSVQALKQKQDPSLILEHASGEGPLNGNWTKDGRFGPQPWWSNRQNLLKHTDVFRTYDVTTMLSVPTTLDRVAQLLQGAQGHPEVTALLNCEDEVYIAATLGCTMGIMRHPLVGLRPSGDPDVFFNGPRQAKRRMDEVVRAVRWQRIAEPYGAGSGTVNLDPNVLTDDWVFQRGETWYADCIGKDARQGAPARVSRSLPLPTVAAEGDRPFVIAGRFPNGAVAVCALERTVKDHAWFMPLADVTVDSEDASGPFGVFGHFRSLTLRLNQPLRHVRILAQDLAGSLSVDVTRQVQIHGDAITIPGSLIDRVGCQDASPVDLSDPGMVVALVRY